MRYRVRFLDDNAFNMLPGKDMDSKVGVAYPEAGEAFVRKSGSRLVDTFTMAHELEHLSGNDLEEHYDKEHKCYYKDFGQMLAPIGGVLGTIFGGPLGGAIGGGLGQLGGSLFGGHKAQTSQMPNQMPNMQASQPESSMPNIIYPQGVGGGMSGVQGSVSSPGATGSSIGTQGTSPANAIANQMAYGYYPSRNPMSQFGQGF